MTIVFGGSFNPPTLAHKKIIDKLKLIYPKADILLLPVGDVYKKKELIAFKHRYHMLKLLFKSTDKVHILDIESQDHYLGTFHSLNELSKTYEDIHFVIGSDHLNQLKKWINYKQLLASYPFIVMNRQSGISIDEAESMFKDEKHQFIFIEFEENISSSLIRKDIHKYQDYLIKEVVDYIYQNHLYEETNHV